MPAPVTVTFHDMIEYLVAHSGGGSVAANQAILRQAILNAYQSIVGGYRWNYLRGHMRIVTEAPVSGTASTRVTYTHSTRALVHETTSWATVASWVEQGRILINGIVCEIDSVSGTTATLSPILNPGSNVAITSEWTLYKNVYTLPADFMSMHAPIDEDGFAISRVDMAELTALERAYENSGEVLYYAVGPHPDFYSPCLFVYPYPSAAETYDFVYNRKPRQLYITGAALAHMAGTVSNSDADVTGVGTSFSDSMVGSVFRFGNANVPDGLAGINPYLDQRAIIAVTDATHLTLESAPSTTYSGVKYRISDAVDLPHHMLEALTRDCERQFAILTGSRSVGQADALWRDSMIRAREADQTFIPPQGSLGYGFNPDDLVDTEIAD